MRFSIADKTLWQIAHWCAPMVRMTDAEIAEVLMNHELNEEKAQQELQHRWAEAVRQVRLQLALS